MTFAEILESYVVLWGKVSKLADLGLGILVVVVLTVVVIQIFAWMGYESPDAD
jgi:hypothetical protein